MAERRLALRGERLTELTAEDLLRVAAGASTLPCVTQGIVCEPSDHLASVCCYTGWCAAGRD